MDKDVVRNSIEDLLTDNGIGINLDDDIDSQTMKFERTPSTVSKMDMVTLEESRKKASRVVESLLRVYLSENFISKSEYIQAKVNLDSMTLGNIMNQMEVSQRAINLLMDELELGDVNPKLFEALGKLQTTFIELVKTQTNYIMTTGNEYEKLSLDRDSTVPVDESTAKDISSGYKSSSQKDLMRLIRNISDKDNK